MKTLSSPESPRQRGMRRVSKPLMEKRRRERINHSLETLRVLMLDNTHNEKLKNPKVEKAEILESVVHFLKTGREAEKGPRAAKRGPAGEQRPAGDRQRSYHDGMRSCLLRVSHFIARKSREEGGAGGDPARARPSSAGAPGAQSLQRLPQRHRQRGAPHQYLSLHGDTSQLLSSSSSSSSTACTHITDPVWRPWPQ